MCASITLRQVGQIERVDDDTVRIQELAQLGDARLVGPVAEADQERPVIQEEHVAALRDPRRPDRAER